MNLPLADTFSLEEEQALISACQQGDQAAFKRLYHNYAKRIFNLSYRLAGDQAEAEEITQEVFIQVWRTISSYAGNSSFYTWLHAVASNIAISYIRKRKRWWRQLVEKTSKQEDTDNEPEGVIEDTNYDTTLEKLIMKLPEQARIVFVLFAIEGFKHDEIAKQLKIAPGTSKAQYHRARKLLAEWLDNEA